MKKVLDENWKRMLMGALALFLLVVLVYTSSKKKSCDRDMMDTYPAPMEPAGEPVITQQASSPPSGFPAPSTSEYDTHYTSITDTPGLVSSKSPTDPSDLLPSDKNTAFSRLNPTDTNPNLLDAGWNRGIDTVAGSMRNANLQIRSEPANPTTSVSVWNQTTITPDTMRLPLEIGGSCKK